MKNSLLLLLAVLLPFHNSFAAAAGEGEGNEFQKLFDEPELPPDLGLLIATFALILIFTWLWEISNDVIEWACLITDQKHILSMRDKLFKELTLLGAISLVLFMVAHSSNVSVHNELVFEFVHLALFALFGLYACLNLGIVIFSIRISFRWEKLELIGSHETFEKVRKLRDRIKKTWITFINPVFRYQMWNAKWDDDYHKIRENFIEQHKLPRTFKFNKYLGKCMKEVFGEIAQLHWSVGVVVLVSNIAIWFLFVSLRLRTEIPLWLTAFFLLVSTAVVYSKTSTILTTLRDNKDFQAHLNKRQDVHDTQVLESRIERDYLQKSKHSNKRAELLDRTDNRVVTFSQSHTVNYFHTGDYYQHEQLDQSEPHTDTRESIEEVRPLPTLNSIKKEKEKTDITHDKEMFKSAEQTQAAPADSPPKEKEKKTKKSKKGKETKKKKEKSTKEKDPKEQKEKEKEQNSLLKKQAEEYQQKIKELEGLVERLKHDKEKDLHVTFATTPQPTRNSPALLRTAIMRSSHDMIRHSRSQEELSKSLGGDDLRHSPRPSVSDLRSSGLVRSGVLNLLSNSRNVPTLSDSELDDSISISSWESRSQSSWSEESTWSEESDRETTSPEHKERSLRPQSAATDLEHSHHHHHHHHHHFRKTHKSQYKHEHLESPELAWITRALVPLWYGKQTFLAVAPYFFWCIAPRKKNIFEVEEPEPTQLPDLSLDSSEKPSEKPRKAAQFRLFWFNRPFFLIYVIQLLIFSIALFLGSALVLLSDIFHDQTHIAAEILAIALAVVLLACFTPTVIYHYAIVSNVGELSKEEYLEEVKEKYHKSEVYKSILTGNLCYDEGLDDPLQVSNSHTGAASSEPMHINLRQSIANLHRKDVFSDTPSKSRPRHRDSEERPHPPSVGVTTPTSGLRSAQNRDLEDLHEI